MKYAFIVTVTERNGLRYDVPAIAGSTCEACMIVLDHVGRIVGLCCRGASNCQPKDVA